MNEKIRALSILDVADKLQLKYGDQKKGSWRKALCFMHKDHTPSLGLHPATNTWHCFVCDKGGSQIDLVMQHEGLSYKEACQWLSKEFKINTDDGSRQHTGLSLLESLKPILMNTNNTQYLDPTLLEQFQGTSNEFTRAMTATGILTLSQMAHAADVYRLGTANDPDHGTDDAVVFWQIDSQGNIREGKIMHYQANGHRSQTRKPVGMSWLLKKLEKVPQDWQAGRCLFGQHLLPSRPDDTVAIVESEKTAVIMSELCPSITMPSTSAPTAVTWLATGGKSGLSVTLLRPLQGRRIILFPDTDSKGTTFADWLAIAKEATKTLGHPVTVSSLLEHHASPSQKERKIDIADYLIEARP